MSAWSNLPNAAHIDRVIESANAYPEVWHAALDAALGAVSDAARDAALDAAWGTSWGTSWSAALGAALNAVLDAALALNEARDEALNAAWGASWGTAWNAALGAALDAVMALIAYDDAAKYLAMSSDELNAWAVWSKNPAAILLIPAVIAYERISELELNNESNT